MYVCIDLAILIVNVYVCMYVPIHTHVYSYRYNNYAYVPNSK